MPNQEDIAHQQELLAAHRRTLAQYLKQQALISELFTPPAIGHGIDEARANIRRVKSTLQAWGIPTEDLPDDEVPPQWHRCRLPSRRFRYAYLDHGWLSFWLLGCWLWG